MMSCKGSVERRNGAHEEGKTENDREKSARFTHSGHRLGEGGGAEKGGGGGGGGTSACVALQHSP